jgi:LPXTG-motif cell wall-anchored protein
VIAGTCVQLTNGTAVTGTFHSTPITLPTVTVIGNTASFPVKLPADFDTKAFHTLTITNAATGRLLLNGQIYVDAAGKITAAPSTGLPRTGASHTADLSKAGIVMLAAGAATTLLARKRRRPQAVAA